MILLRVVSFVSGYLKLVRHLWIDLYRSVPSLLLVQVHHLLLPFKQLLLLASSFCGDLCLNSLDWTLLSTIFVMLILKVVLITILMQFFALYFLIQLFFYLLQQVPFLHYFIFWQDGYTLACKNLLPLLFVL